MLKILKIVRFQKKSTIIKHSFGTYQHNIYRFKEESPSSKRVLFSIFSFHFELQKVYLNRDETWEKS